MVIDVRGLKFGFVGFDGAGGSAPATSSSPGTAPMTSSNIKSSIAAARKVSDIVIALPQWSTREYVAAWTSQQLAWRNEMFAAGADHIIGADNHWAAGLSITPGGVSGNHLAIDSQGNFWFGQDWSRQTEEGVMTMTTFVGTRLAQVRLIPTVVLDDAQPNLTNPATDGQFVLQQVPGASIPQARWRACVTVAGACARALGPRLHSAAGYLHQHRGEHRAPSDLSSTLFAALMFCGGRTAGLPAVTASPERGAGHGHAGKPRSPVPAAGFAGHRNPIRRPDRDADGGRDGIARPVAHRIAHTRGATATPSASRPQWPTRHRAREFLLPDGRGGMHGAHARHLDRRQI